MITKHTTQAQRTHQSAGTLGTEGRMAVGIGVAAAALLIVLALLASRTAMPQLSLAGDLRALVDQVADTIGLSSTSTVAMRSYPLGIALPQGTDVSKVPAGLTDYIPADRQTTAAKMRSYPVGIALPHG